MKILRQYSLAILSSVIICLVVISGFSSLSQKTYEHQKESLEKALKRGLMQSYALEGRYPASLDELIDNYHILYNEDLFEVKYELIASNIMPDITIIERR